LFLVGRVQGQEAKGQGRQAEQGREGALRRQAARGDRVQARRRRARRLGRPAILPAEWSFGRKAEDHVDGHPGIPYTYIYIHI